MNNKTFLHQLGLQIKKVRLKKGIRQTALANRCGFEKASMSKIEAGKINVTILTLRRISKALKTDIKKLLPE